MSAPIADMSTMDFLARKFVISVFIVIFLAQEFSVCTQELSSTDFTMYGTKTRYIDSLSLNVKTFLRRISETQQGSKTSQEIIRDKTSPQKISVHHENEIQRKNNVLLKDVCKPLQVHFLGRHGIRNPGSSDIATINKVLQRLSKSLIGGSKRLNDLKSAIKTFGSETEKELTESGWVELENIGTRFGNRFPEIFKDSESEGELLFQATSKSRTVDSCKAFVSSLNEMGYDVPSTISERNDLLRFFDNCERFIEEVENRPDALAEHQKFRNAEFPSVGNNIVRRLGLEKGEITLTPKEVKAIYVMAASEIAIHNTSTWHQYFSHDDLKVMEYAADLKNYWKKSYGYEINYLQSCVYLQDTFQHLTQAIEGTSFKKGVFSFAHAETLLPVLSLMGLYQDRVPLTASSFNSIKMEHRLFKTSNICPFASNIAIVLYTCDTEVSNLDEYDIIDETGSVMQVPKRLSKYMIRLLFKEQNIKFPFCQHDLCSYDKVLNFYEKPLSECNWDQLCKSSNTKDEL